MKVSTASYPFRWVVRLDVERDDGHVVHSETVGHVVSRAVGEYDALLYVADAAQQFVGKYKTRKNAHRAVVSAWRRANRYRLARWQSGKELQP